MNKMMRVLYGYRLMDDEPGPGGAGRSAAEQSAARERSAEEQSAGTDERDWRSAARERSAAANDPTKNDPPPEFKPVTDAEFMDAAKSLLPDGQKFNEGMVKAMMPAMDELKLTVDQRVGVAKAFVEFQKASATAAQEQYAADMKAEAEACCKATTQEERDLAKRFVLSLDEKDPLRYAICHTSLGNIPSAVKAFAQLGKRITDGAAPGAGGGGNKPIDLADALGIRAVMAGEAQ